MICLARALKFMAVVVGTWGWWNVGWDWGRWCKGSCGWRLLLPNRLGCRLCSLSSSSNLILRFRTRSFSFYFEFSCWNRRVLFWVGMISWGWGRRYVTVELITT